jgi:hypothetical protein
MKFFKSFLPALIIAALPLASAFAINISVDGSPLELTTSPVIENGTTLVPMRAIFEELGLEVKWDDATKTVTGTTDGLEIKLTLGSNTAYVNGMAKTIPVPAKAINGSTMVPVRFIADALGNTIEWDEANQTVNVFSFNLSELDLDEQKLIRTTVLISNEMVSVCDYLEKRSSIDSESDILTLTNKLKTFTTSIDKHLSELSALTITNADLNESKIYFTTEVAKFSDVFKQVITALETQDESLLEKALSDMRELDLYKIGSQIESGN